jgi:hypothetical protein
MGADEARALQFEPWTDATEGMAQNQRHCPEREALTKGMTGEGLLQAMRRHGRRVYS